MIEERQPLPGQGTETEASSTQGSDLNDPRMLQILMTEHWGLLATRSMSWNETFSRAGMFLMALSGAIVALALVAQASSFGEGFIVFAFILLPFVLFVGLAAFIRLNQSSNDEVQLVLAMNRLRHAYVEMTPGVARYLSTSTFDDLPGYFVSIGVPQVSPLVAGAPSRASASIGSVLHGLVTTMGMIGTIDALIAGVIGALVGHQLRLGTTGVVVLGAVVFVVVLAILIAYAVSQGIGMLRQAEVRFPSPPAEPGREAGPRST
jgi:hypothetical protein